MNLEVDSWNIKYDKDDNLIETEGKRVQMSEVHDLNIFGLLFQVMQVMYQIFQRRKTSHLVY